MDLGLAGKSVLVTCAGSGVGLACAELLAAEGAFVTALTRSLKTPDEAPQGKRIRWLTCDITDPGSLSEAAAEISAIDSMVFIPVREENGASLDFSPKAHVEAFQRSLAAYALLLQTFVPAMVERQYGRVVAIVGASALAPLWDHSLSNVTRAGIVALTSGNAREFARFGVSFNTVVLGLVDTPGLMALWTSRAARMGLSLEAYRKERLEQIPARRLAEPEEAAQLICTLLSPKLASLNGQSIWLDGGSHAKL